MSLFMVLKKVNLRLEHIQRNFLWGGAEVVQKPDLVNWSIVCSHKTIRGLGTRNLSSLNKVFLGKLCWRYISKSESLWKSVIA